MTATSTLKRLRERYVSEPRAKRKLLRGIRRIAELADDEVQSIDALVDIIRGIGLRWDGRGVYGAEAAYMNHTHHGLWQIPQQLAQAMVLLSRQNIETFLETGTHTGYTSSVLVAYLYRVNPRLTGLTVDPTDFFKHYEEIRDLIPIEYRCCTSDDLAGNRYDCVFIDGDHAYEGVSKDYANVGRHARVCMFHDINDELVGFDTVPRFWRELIDSGAFSETHEFLNCPPGRRVMGIGIGIRGA